MTTRIRGLLWIGVVAISLLGLSSPVFAQNGPPTDRNFSPQLFHPSVGPDEFITISPAIPLPHLNYSAGLWVNYGLNSFAILNIDNNNKITGIRTNLLQNAMSADLVFAIGLFNRFQLGVGIPMVLYQSGQDFNYTDASSGSGTVKAPSGFALGDPWLDIKARLYGKDRGVNLSLAPFITFPGSQATPNNFSGDTSVGVGGNVLAGWESDRWRAGLSVGFLYRVAESNLFSTTIGSEVLYGAAIAFDAIAQRKLSLIGEIHGRTDISDHCRDSVTNKVVDGICVSNVDANPLEVDIAAKVRFIRSLYGTAGVGTGIIKGVGSPQVRAFLGLTFSPDRRDRDNDGVPDADDKCPDTPEDRDGFQDDDGCPDPDNDGDNIPDVRDRCPNAAEDFDNFQDEDGCPEPDNDGDGIPDIKDACPNDKEDGKPPRPTDGCPIDKTDSDEDGIPDNKDKCPLEPEDKDGFEDEDGCPDVDNDKDGIPDQYDKCPNDPEDVDGFEDDDGCPDPDNDHDGVLDKEDKCPNEPETINGYKDEDGCPDNGPPPKVQIVGDEIVILEKVFFDTAKASIKKVSFNLLEQVATTLRAHREILKVRIEGHTDAQGKRDKNMKLSQDRAESVMGFLAAHGVDPGRMQAQGFGPDRPVSDNKTSRGREANRRVEFHITERAKQTAPTPDKPVEQTEPQN
jgi:outer membrane protein OmpA-like peptidoglycan-associated protein